VPTAAATISARYVDFLEGDIGKIGGDADKDAGKDRYQRVLEEWHCGLKEAKDTKNSANDPADYPSLHDASDDGRHMHNGGVTCSGWDRYEAEPRHSQQNRDRGQDA
jgi:hypothetical protein